MKWTTSVLTITGRSIGWLLIFATSLVCWPNSSLAYTPDSPEVREMLSRAVAFLADSNTAGVHSGRLGGRAVVGLALYKYEKRFGGGAGTLPPLTRSALAHVVAQARNPSSLSGEDNYSIGLALIFLTEVNPTDHTGEISVYLDELVGRQKVHGGWGYKHLKTGDISQLQYAVLGCWAAKMLGLEVRTERIGKVLDYLLRTQDPGGGWGYQGKDSGGSTRVAQSQVRNALCAAGLGSVYVAADFLGMSKKGDPKKVSNRKLPPALMPVVEDTGRRSGTVAGTSVDIERMRQAMNDGKNWFRQNSNLQTSMWQFYFLYGYERFNSFREKVEGTYEEEPRWYNEGVRLMQGLQKEDGSFGGAVIETASPTGADPPVATAFGVLFLLRSTRETIEQVIEREGLLKGGRGLPDDLTEVRMQGNKLVAPAITGEVADLITMLEDEEGANIENMLDNPDALSLSGLKGAGREFKARLGRILRNGSWQARIVAARTLGRQSDLENVPVLIYALSDGDPRVVQAARDGLRLTSRKFDGFGLPDKPSDGQKRVAVTQWKKWYKSVRPDAVFID